MILAILGAGAHAQDVAAIAQAEDRRRFVKFYDDNLDGYLNCSQATRLRCTIGVNDPATKQRLARWGGIPQTVVHPTATIDPTATITPGCVIGAGTHIGPHTYLGPHVHVGAGCTITRTTVGEFTTIAPGVDIAGDVWIGALCLIGVGATVKNLTTIGDRTTVGAGAVVVTDIASDMTVAGVPARPLHQRPEAA